MHENDYITERYIELSADPIVQKEIEPIEGMWVYMKPRDYYTPTPPNDIRLITSIDSDSYHLDRWTPWFHNDNRDNILIPSPNWVISKLLEMEIILTLSQEYIVYLTLHFSKIGKEKTWQEVLLEIYIEAKKLKDQK